MSISHNASVIACLAVAEINLPIQIDLGQGDPEDALFSHFGNAKMITSNIFLRTFQLKYRNQTGTCFTIDVDGRQYLCTARHLLNEFNGEQIELFHKNEWKILEVDLVGYGSESADICILAPRIQLSPPLPLPLGIGKMAIGQDVYFLGYPYGWRTEGSDFTNHFPIPLVKRATLSAVIFDEPQKLLLDGHNNLGFSGAPVVFRKMGQSDDDLYLASIVSAYRCMPEPILDEKGNKTPLKYYENTGIIVSHSIKHAIESIHENPIGFELEG